MNAHILVCCSSLLVLNLVGAKPLSDLQSLKTNSAPHDSSSEGKDAHSDKSLFGALEEPPWDRSSDPSNSALEAKENLLARLFKDLVRTSKRSWSRNKKGGLRSCFGVRLERIGSFSGLGC